MKDKRVGIVGVGLVGGSLALALKQAGYGGEIIGYDLDLSVDLLVDRFIDRPSDSLSALAEECDVLVLATPVRTAKALLSEIVPLCAAGTVITDVGSTKQAFAAAAREVLKRKPDEEVAVSVVPGHPIAGCEKSGAGAARADLFQGCTVVLTPIEDTDSHALDVVACLWELVGARPVQMDAAEHDALFAAVSHLPHMLAYTLVRMLAASRHRDRVVDYAAGGLRDFTRIAESDPAMWRDICLANRDNILEVLDGFEVEFKHLYDAVRRGDADSLNAFFKCAGKYRCLNISPAAAD